MFTSFLLAFLFLPFGESVPRKKRETKHRTEKKERRRLRLTSLFPSGDATAVFFKRPRAPRFPAVERPVAHGRTYTHARPRTTSAKARWHKSRTIRACEA